jgi:hypothetical protein
MCCSLKEFLALLHVLYLPKFYEGIFLEIQICEGRKARHFTFA